MPSPARQVAFDVLRKVHEGGFASDLLLKRSAGLDSRDAALASEIVFGCLRYQAQLDHLIGLLAVVRDPEIRIALRTGVYHCGTWNVFPHTRPSVILNCAIGSSYSPPSLRKHHSHLSPGGDSLRAEAFIFAASTMTQTYDDPFRPGTPPSYGVSQPDPLRTLRLC